MFIKNLFQKVIKNNLSHIEYLEELARVELECRYQKSVQQLLKSAKLPRNKLLLDFDMT